MFDNKTFGRTSTRTITSGVIEKNFEKNMFFEIKSSDEFEIFENAILVFSGTMYDKEMLRGGVLFLFQAQKCSRNTTM